MKILIFILFGIISFNSYSKTCCLCQTGIKPSSEVHWFKKGCKMWLAKQKSCDSKKVISIDKDSNIDSALECEDGNIKLGYVGHWGSSAQLVKYLKQTLIPTAKYYNSAIDYDQTACTSMDNPRVIERFFETLNLDVLLSVKGNQVTSTGMWDDVLPHKTNFWAKINSQDKLVEYPTCKSFRNKTCFGKYQKNETGICLNEDEQVELKCTKVSRNIYRWK